MTRNSKARIYLNQMELIELNDFLRTVCSSTQVDDRREATYTHPWTDLLVVGHMREKIPHIQISHVQGLRARVFGELARPRKQGRPSTTLVERVAALEAAVTGLAAWAKACGREET